MINLSTTSWVKLSLDAVAPTAEELAELWQSRPSTRETMNMFGKPIPMPRFQRMYGASKYSFSGITLAPARDEVTPALVQRCLDFANENNSEFAYNGALVNWYMSGDDSISPHSDDEKEMENGAPIYSFSFGGVRTFEIKAKPESLDKVFVPDIKFRTLANCCIVMGGTMQREFVHGVPKSKAAVNPRINITVRAFKQAKKQKVSTRE